MSSRVERETATIPFAPRNANFASCSRIRLCRSVWRLRKSLRESKGGHDDYWQAGRSVAHIDEVLPAAEVVRRLAEAARTRPSAAD